MQVFFNPFAPWDNSVWECVGIEADAPGIGMGGACLSCAHFAELWRSHQRLGTLGQQPQCALLRVHWSLVL